MIIRGQEKQVLLFSSNFLSLEELVSFHHIPVMRLYDHQRANRTMKRLLFKDYRAADVCWADGMTALCDDHLQAEAPRRG